MNVRRSLILALFLLPTVAMVIAIFLHKPTGDYILITANQLRQTQTAWTNQVYTPIETNAEFNIKLQGLRMMQNGVQLSAVELASLQQAITNLVLANYLGDYDAYRRFRVPVANYDMISEDAKKGWDDWFHAVFTNTPVPSSFDEVDRQIWSHIFSGHHYWLAIGLDNSDISLLVTNQIPSMFSIEASDPSRFHCLESVTPGTFSFHSAMEETLVKHGKLLVAKINFMVDTDDPPKSPRPFLYVLVFYPNANVWLPIELAQCSTTGSKYPPPF